MNPTSTRRLRRTTAALAVAWSLLAIILSFAAIRPPEDVLYHPFNDSQLAGTAVIQSLDPAAAATDRSITGAVSTKALPSKSGAMATMRSINSAHLRLRTL